MKKALRPWKGAPIFLPPRKKRKSSSRTSPPCGTDIKTMRYRHQDSRIHQRRNATCVGKLPETPNSMSDGHKGASAARPLTTPARYTIHGACPPPRKAPAACLVDEGVCVVLEQQVLQHATLGHKAEQVEIAACSQKQSNGKVRVKQGQCSMTGVAMSAAVSPKTPAACLPHKVPGNANVPQDSTSMLLPATRRQLTKEDVQPHLDVVSILVLERGHLAANPRSRLIDVDFVALCRKAMTE